MRMSCNGCRVLRKGCSDNCNIRPCLQWIKTPDSQANATVFLAKFYGRAGLINLITAGPDHLRPAIFRSLLYEACGRIVNPIYGSVGLLWSGNWQLCQAAVEAVLRGAPITPITSDAAVTSDGPPLKAYDICHVSKDENSAASSDLHKVRTRCRFKHNAGGSSSATARACKPPAVEPSSKNRSTSHESSLSHQSELAANVDVDGDSREVESIVSEEMADLSVLFRAETQSPSPPAEQIEKRGNSSLLQEQEGGVGLELTLGFEPVSRVQHPMPVKKRRFEERWSKSGGACKMELGL